MVGQAVAGKLMELGHDVVIGTRRPEQLADWLRSVRYKGRAGSFAEAAHHGEVLFHATNGATALQALEMAGRDNLAGKILIDISNPLDFSSGMPPTLSICNDDSLGEQIQRAFPNTSVVKSLNTVNAEVMVNPALVADADHHVFISGDDAKAKERVAEILRTWFGWRHVIDLGDITTARGTEMYLPIWLRLWQALGTPHFNIKVVR